MPTTTVNGTDLYYEVHGQGTPILGIHGTPSAALLWVDPARRLGTRGKCVIYDRRGFLRSAPHRRLDTLDLAEHVEDAAALLDALALTPAVVVGRSTGGQIALELARRFPEKVRALALLEPALFSIDPDAAVWAERLREQVLREAAGNPASASRAVLRAALGDQAWDALAGRLRDLFDDLGPAVLAELRGHGLDLSEDPLDLTDRELAGLGQPTLLVSADDSPPALRRVNDRLALALPHAEHVLVPGGHLIDPAHPVVLGFVDRVVAPLGRPA